jgi:hypothetical protein
VGDEQGRRRLFLATIAYVFTLDIKFYMTSIRIFFSYPLSNAILLAPLSIIRWMENAGSNFITSEESLAVGAVFGLSGLTNVLLFLLIRPNLLLFRRDHCERCSKMDSTVLPSSTLRSPIPIPPMLKSVQPAESVEMVTVQVEPKTRTVADGGNRPV